MMAWWYPVVAAPNQGRRVGRNPLVTNISAALTSVGAQSSGTGGGFASAINVSPRSYSSSALQVSTPTVAPSVSYQTVKPPSRSSSRLR